MRRLLVPLAALLAAATAVPAQAQPATVVLQVFCMNRADVARQMMGAFGGRLVAAGQLDPRRIASLYVAPDGTWTVVAEDVTGVACVLLEGKGMAPALEEPKADGPETQGRDG
jgi:hypothetical protein